MTRRTPLTGTPGRMQRVLCSGILGLQSVVLLLTTPVLLTLTDISTPAGLATGLGLTAACLVAAGSMRSPTGPVLGWGVQAATLLLGFVLPVMFALGVVFLALYGGAWFLGATIDRERAARASGT
jgi:hypothetical protein